MTMTTAEALPSGATPVQDEQADPGQQGTAPVATDPAYGDSTLTLIVEPVLGEGGEEGAPGDPQGHSDVGPDGSEAMVEVAEASAEDLAAPAGEGSALGDLRGIEGFEEAIAAESAGVAQGLLPDAGMALGEGKEFLGFLAPLAATVAPWLVSTAGPAIAGAVFDRLSGRAKRVVSKPPQGTGAVPLLVGLLNHARKRTADGGAEAVDESIVDEVVRAMEAIVGTDDRVRIAGTVAAPWRWICALRIEFPTGAAYRGTGFLIGPRAVATAGHCVYLHNQGGWARRIEVIPGCDGNKRPYGSAVATGYRSTDGWVKDRLPTSDYGVTLLPADPFGGRQLGSFGFGAFPNNILLAAPAVLAGYPGDKPFAEPWGTARRIKEATSDQLRYDIDSMGGQSGAGVYITHNGRRYVVGIHNYGASTGNTATRVTKPVATNLLRWSRYGMAGGPAAA
jgi:glutamyl endopeptidase